MQVRDAVRAVLITPLAEVLLMRIRHPERGDCFWIVSNYLAYGPPTTPLELEVLED